MKYKTCDKCSKTINHFNEVYYGNNEDAFCRDCYDNLNDDVFIVEKNVIEDFGKPLKLGNIVAVKHSLKSAQQEHVILCNCAKDCKAYNIRGPYPGNDLTVQAFISRLTGGAK